MSANASKDLNCAAISSSQPSPNNYVVWDRSDFPSSLLDPDAVLFDLHRDIIRSMTDPPERRFFRYLSLCSKDEYIQGLSVHVSGRGIVGLETHFARTSQLSGYRGGCVLHFPLCPEERIAYAWLRIVNSPSSAFGAPALVVGFYRLFILVATNMFY